jgi:AcrR family transcriptional regulator
MSSDRPVRARSKKVEQGDATREALLAVARRQFSERGYADTSLDQIAQLAGVTKGALYHHFSGKEELFRLVFEAVKKELAAEAFPVNVVQDDTALWRDLISRCRAYIEAHTAAKVQRIVLTDARAVLNWEDWHRVESEYGVVAVRGYLRRAMHRRLIAQLPLQPLSTILGGALIQACMLVANASDRARAIDEAVAIIERLLEGLRPRPGDAANA